MAKIYTLPDGDTVSLHESADIATYLLQVKLNKMGAKPRLAEDGFYGPATRRAEAEALAEGKKL